MRTWIFSGLMLLSANCVHASPLVASGHTTFDSVTGLYWLDMSRSDGQSVDDALATHTRFHVATQRQVMQMFVDAGLPGKTTSLPTNSEAAALVALLGRTLTNSSEYGFQGFALGKGGQYYNDPFATVQNDGTSYVYKGLSPRGWLSGSQAIENVGVFLVRRGSAPLKVAATDKQPPHEHPREQTHSDKHPEHSVPTADRSPNNPSGARSKR